jgi:hypothetical protein
MKIKIIMFADKEELLKTVVEPIEIGKVKYVTYNQNHEEIIHESCFRKLDEIPDEFFESNCADMYILFQDGNFAISEQIFDVCGDYHYWFLNYYKPFTKENFKEEK